MFSYISILTGNHTIAVVKGSEDYTTIAQSFWDVFQEINQISVELFLSGDYKVSKYYIWRCINMGLTGDVLVPQDVINH